ncbi:MAG: YfhO family protein [Anaerolineales bacterium]|nr:YfhO family protein [Anaerolineales bacterium]
MRFRNFLRTPEFIVILAPFILYAPVLFEGAMFWGTPALQFHPWHVAAWETLKSGYLPLWNPLSGMGAPLIANYQSALFYPPNWLYFLLAALGGNVAMAWGMGLLTAAHLSLAGVGMVRLTRALGLGTVAQTISGLAFGMSGYLVARSHFLSINVTVAWLPWILWTGYEGVIALKVPESSHEILQVPGKKGNFWEFVGIQGNSFLRLTFFLAMLLLAGHAQTAWYTFLLTGIWLLFWTWRTAPRPSAFIHTLSLFALAGLAAVALSAVQLIPTAELLAQSQRASGADYDFVMTYSFWPWRLIGVLAPGFFGSPATGDYWGYANYWEDAIYIGLLPFLLALRTFPIRRNPKTPASSFPHHLSLITPLLWLLIGLSFLLALGQNTPIFPFLYRYVPTFDLFQAPTRWTLWMVFALALLAGIGAETWRGPVGKRAQGGVLRGIVIAAAILIAALAAGWVIPGLQPSFVRATALAGGLGIMAGLFSLYAPKSEGTALAFGWWVGLFVAFDLILANWGLIPSISLDFYRNESENATLVGDGRLFLSARDEYALTFDRYLRFDTFHTDFTHFRAALLPNLNLLDHLPSANNFDPLRPDRYVRWMEALDTASYAQQKQMLGMMGVTIIEHYVPDAGPAATFESFPGNARFQWVPCVWNATDGENAWDLLFETPSQLDQPYLIVEGYKTNAQYVCEEGETANVQLLEESANEILLRVDGNSSGWVFIADTWYPGWTAEVNGEAAQVYRANYLFRAVQVPAGGGEVVLRYRPVGFWVGALISVTSCLGIGILALRRRFANRK